MGKLKLMTIIGTRPEIIRLSATIKCCDRYFEQILVHTGQNYDYTLNQVFFDDLGLRAPDYYLNAVGDDLGATIGNIIEKSYKLMVQVRPDAVLVLGDTNSCLSVIGAKRLHIPIFHMEAGNRCKDECLPEEPTHCGYHQRYQSLLFRARTPVSDGVWTAKGAHLRDRQPHGRGTARQSG